MNYLDGRVDHARPNWKLQLIVEELLPVNPPMIPGIDEFAGKGPVAAGGTFTQMQQVSPMVAEHRKRHPDPLDPDSGERNRNQGLALEFAENLKAGKGDIWRVSGRNLFAEEVAFDLVPPGFEKGPFGAQAELSMELVQPVRTHVDLAVRGGGVLCYRVPPALWPPNERAGSKLRTVLIWKLPAGAFLYEKKVSTPRRSSWACTARRTRVCWRVPTRRSLRGRSS